MEPGYRASTEPTRPDLLPYHCPRCDANFAERELRPVKLGLDDAVGVCPRCGAIPRYERSTPRAEFSAGLKGAFAYPFLRDGWISLVAVGLVVHVVGYGGLFGVVLNAGLVVTWLFTIVQATARGEDEFPAAADFVGLTDLLRPLARFGVAALVAAAPLAGAVKLTGGATSAGAWALYALAAVVGVGYLPAGVLVAAMRDEVYGPLNPLPVAAIVTRIPRAYGLTTAALAGLALAAPAWAALAWGVAKVLAKALPFVPGWFQVSATLVVPVVMARMLGLLLREHATAVGDT